MTKIYNRIIGLLMSLCLVVAFTACNESVDYEMASVPNNAQVFFHNNISTKVNLSNKERTFTIPVYRLDTIGSLTVPVTFSYDEEGVFTLPTSVTFEDGSRVAYMEIGYDASKFEYDVYVPLTATIDESQSTPYGFNSIDFQVGIPATWTTLGKATYCEVFIGDLLGLPAEYEVTIQESDVKPGLYRLVAPYGSVYPYYGYRDEYDTSKSYYLEIDATDPDKVIIAEQETGIDMGYGMTSVLSMAYYYIENGAPEKAESYYGTLKDGVITFPAGGLLVSFADYNDGALMIANRNGSFYVALPGYGLSE